MAYWRKLSSKGLVDDRRALTMPSDLQLETNPTLSTPTKTPSARVKKPKNYKSALSTGVDNTARKIAKRLPKIR